MNNLVLQLLVFTMAGWLHRGQQQGIDYLLEENRVLREQLGTRRLRLTDAQRRRLAIRAQALGRKALAGVACIVTPDTLLRWYRKLVAKKYDGSRQIVMEYVDHYHFERNHQGLGNELIDRQPANDNGEGPVKCRQRLGGTLRYYYRDAA